MLMSEVDLNVVRTFIRVRGGGNMYLEKRKWLTSQCSFKESVKIKPST